MPEASPSITGVDDRGIRLRPGRDAERFDVLIAERRVWSVTIDSDVDFVPWPEALGGHVRGPADVAIRAASGEPLWRGPVVFAEASTGDGLFVDEQGRDLVVNKWGRATRSVEGDDAFARRLLASLQTVIDVLEGLGVEPFITGGTLLGAIRSGSFLPHDDDADVGYLSRGGDAIAVVLESLGLERALARQGLDVRAHSRSHLQVLFSDESGRIDHYVDLFPGFTVGDRYCQPIAVRTRAQGLALLPRTTVTIEGASLPSVADPETWLARCYGPGWRVPDPSFRFITPPSTRRRFENWFGVFNTNREFWEDLHAAGEREGEAIDGRLLDLLRDRWEDAPAILDLGCGTGELAVALADGGVADIVAADFSRPGLARVRAAADDAARRVRAVECNFADGRALLGMAAPLLRERRDWRIVMSHVLEGLVPDTRADVLRIVRHLTDCGGDAVATVGTTLPAAYRHEDPRTWHLPLEVLGAEAAAAGLRVEVLGTAEWRSLGALRSEATVALTADVNGRAR